MNAPNRVQNQTYAIRENYGKNKIEVIRNEIYDEEKNKKEHKIKYGKSNETNIEIFFLSMPDENIQVIYKENPLNCTIKNKSLDCIVNKYTFEPEKNYILSVTDLCGKEKYNFNFKIEEEKEEEDEDKIGTVAILFIIIAGLFIIVIVSFFIYRSVNKNKSVNIEQVQENKLLSDI